MNNTEQLIILAAVAWVSYLVGQAKANKATACTNCKETANANQASDSPSMDWFANWSGLK